MSYHLHALERWGVIERAGVRGDARERPWRATGKSLTVNSFESGASRPAADVIAAESLARVGEAIRRWSSNERHESAVWREVSTMRRSFLWLTESEATGFAAELRAVFDRYVGDRDAAHHPAGTRRIISFLALVPEVPDDER